jgi:hypothetical protein
VVRALGRVGDVRVGLEAGGGAVEGDGGRAGRRWRRCGEAPGSGATWLLLRWAAASSADLGAKGDLGQVQWQTRCDLTPTIHRPSKDIQRHQRHTTQTTMSRTANPIWRVKRRLGQRRVPYSVIWTGPLSSSVHRFRSLPFTLFFLMCIVLSFSKERVHLYAFFPFSVLYFYFPFLDFSLLARKNTFFYSFLFLYECIHDLIWMNTTFLTYGCCFNTCIISVICKYLFLILVYKYFSFNFH